MPSVILALDQGTTSSRAIVFSREGRSLGSGQEEFPQILPSPGHVEHDPEAIWQSQLNSARKALAAAKVSSEDVAAIGVTNQRETTLLWERDSGRPIGNAIVWQSRITAPLCERLKAEGHEPTVRKKTGLVLDPYFSGTKIRHLLDAQPGLRERAERGEVLFGTVDSFLIWRMTGGKTHVTDVTNASRTLLLNLQTLDWDDELLKILGVPRKMLPQVVPSSGVVAETDPTLFGRAIPIAGIAGDQQAATFGQACFTPGSAKNTYGTGCFMLMNIGAQPRLSENRLLTTVGWQVNGQTTYCLEGSVFIAGAVVQWLRDGLGLITNSSDIEKLAAAVPDSGGVVLVPAFVGLGAPYWDSSARGSVFGITRGTTAGHLARAALDSMVFQSNDLVEAMRKDAGLALTQLKVDGGASVNNALMQFQADISNVIVRRPVVPETTALGAAYLAGLAVGYWQDLADVERNWALDREFTPGLSAEARDSQLARWHKAVSRTLEWEQ
jgi:glycerol kinase